MSSVKFAVLYLKEPVLVNCLQAKAYKEDVQQLQRFLEMINFYRHFMPNIAKTQKPFTSEVRYRSQNNQNCMTSLPNSSTHFAYVQESTTQLQLPIILRTLEWLRYTIDSYNMLSLAGYNSSPSQGFIRYLLHPTGRFRNYLSRIVI